MAGSEFQTHLETRGILVADGGIGTYLMASGMDKRALPLMPIADPDAVFQVHLEYLKAGAQVIETHTFEANASKLGALGLVEDVYSLNRRAAQLARHARDTHGRPSFIMGSLGPLAVGVEASVGPGITYGNALEIYREAVHGLVAGGVDGFMVETMSDRHTVLAAVTAIRQESLLPIVVTFAFSPDGETLYGLTPEDAITFAAELPGGPPFLVGANCGSGPAPLLDAVLRMAPIAKKYGIALAAYPNAGEPSRRGGHIHYPASPEYVGTIAPALRAAGAVLIGGCCGTNPEHTVAIARSLADPRVWTVPNWEPGIADPHHIVEPTSEAIERGLGALFERQFVVSVELDPPRGITVSRVLDAARTVYNVGADVVNIGDSPMARVRLSAMATARLIEEQIPIQTILHFTTRDRNLMGIQSDLLGAHALGVRNVLCLTGDPPGLGDYAHATAVYDLDSIGLVKVLEGFNHGHDALGQAIGVPTQFDIGVGMNPNASDVEHEITRSLAKVEAGAQFIMLQPIYDPAILYEFLEKARLPANIPLVLGVMPLVSYRQALYLHNEVPGINIPTPILEQLASHHDGQALGSELAIQLIDDLSHIVSGVYLVPSYNRVASLVPIIQHIRQTRPTIGSNSVPSDG